MGKYVDINSLANSIEYFRSKDYSKPEQIGLFLYFKASGLNGFGYAAYKKWGDFEQNERENCLRRLYDLAGVFDAVTENGLKYCALFPFSIANYYRSSNYYNGGSPFKMLGSRISDTLDNSLVSTIIQRDLTNKNNLKFNDGYLTYIKNNQLKGNYIPLAKIAAWCFRFWRVEMPETADDRDFTDVLILAFLSHYNISYSEFVSLFMLDTTEIASYSQPLPIERFRDLLKVCNGNEVTPEIEESSTVDYMPISKVLGKEECLKLLSMRGDVLNNDRISSILKERDKELQDRYAWESKSDVEKEILTRWKNKEFEYIDVEPLYEQFQLRYGKKALESKSGSALLHLLFGRKEDDSLVYNLEFTTDYFGGIGGFRTIYTLYQKGNDWKFCISAKNVQNITEAQAIEKAEEYRNKFVSLFGSIDDLIENNSLKTVEDYSVLQSLIKETLGSNLYGRNWVWKYLHMIYPDIFMNFFTSEWVYKVFRVAKIVPENTYVRQCGQYSIFSKNLGVKNVYLYHILLAMDDAEEAEDEGEELMNDSTGMGLPIRQPRTNKGHALNCILYGAPGTGKTYSTACHALSIVSNRPYTEVAGLDRKELMQSYNEMVNNGKIIFTTFHQNYGYEDFIQGLRPVNGEQGVEFKPIDGVFKKIADKAMRDFSNNYVIIIDEINRANISKVFGELITLIEDDKRWGEINAICVNLPTGEKFAVPNNLYIIGTMNSADKSISLIDTALRRRFEFVEVIPNSGLIEDETLRKVLDTLNANLVDQLESTDLLIGHAYFIDKTIDDLARIMNCSIIPLLYEYFYDNAKKVKEQVKKAIDGTGFVIIDSKVGRIQVSENPTEV